MDELIILLQKEFGFESPKIKKLNGYFNVNYLVSAKNKAFILKTYRYNQELFDTIEAENKALLHLNLSDKDKYPSPIAFSNGEHLRLIHLDGKKTICRLLSYLEGDFLGDTTPTKSLYQSFGTFLAKLNRSLEGFSEYILKARELDWDLQYLHLNKKFLEDIENPSNRNLVRHFFSV
jgi:Ser/Thr protein kinase RdoA (MazF antagonist)